MASENGELDRSGREDVLGFEAQARRVVAEQVPGGDLDAMEVMFNFLRTAARVVHDLETNVHRPLGVSWAGFRMLFYIWTAGPIAPSEIARLSSVSRASVSSVVDTLERKRLVVRTQTSPDRRLVTVQLTGHGRRQMALHWRKQNEREQRWAAALDPVQRVALVDALRALARHDVDR